MLWAQTTANNVHCCSFTNRFTLQHEGSGIEEERDTENEKEKTPVKTEQRISPVDSPINLDVPSEAAPLIDDAEIIAPDLNIEADIDMLHNSVSFIEALPEANEFDDVAPDSELPDDVQQLQQLQQDIYPTITSVTSLHPQFKYNELISYDANPLDSSHTKIL